MGISEVGKKNSEAVSPLPLPLDPTDEQLHRASQDVCFFFFFFFF